MNIINVYQHFPVRVLFEPEGDGDFWRPLPSMKAPRKEGSRLKDDSLL